MVSGTLNSAIEDQYNQYVVGGQAERAIKTMSYIWRAAGGNGQYLFTPAGHES
jgi:hypothetical protein